MPESLDTGDKLYAEPCGIFVYLAKLSLRISAALVAEKRLAVYLICILGLEHGAVIAHFRENPEKALERGNAHNGISRAVYHHAEAIKVFQFCVLRIFHYNNRCTCL